MLAKSQGIVIKSTRYSESSAIVKMYTLSHGMLSFMIQAVYSKKSSLKPALLQPMQVLDLDYYFTDNKTLHKIKEARSAFSLNHLHFEMKRSAVALVVSELIFKCVQEEEENEALYKFLVSCIQIMDDPGKDSNNFLVYFMLHFSRYLGFFPANSYSEETPNFDLYEGQFKVDSGVNAYLLDMNSSFIMSRIIQTKIEHFDQYPIPQNQRLKLIEHLIDYYKIHVSNFQTLRSFEVIKDLYKVKN